MGQNTATSLTNTGFTCILETVHGSHKQLQEKYPSFFFLQIFPIFV